MTSAYVPPPKDMTNFTRALSSEIRILLDEVGKLRDERRALQFEIAELMSVKSKHGAGGAYDPDWRPATAPPGQEQALVPVPPPVEDAPPVAARPGWRVVNKRDNRRVKAIAQPPRATATPPPQAAPLPAPPAANPRSDLPAWAQWRPNPLLAPTPVASSSAAPMPSSPPARSGLFGPSTPPPK
ncbi:hypothetical protein DL96DRAFT_1578121 [Flagelloscypha sp. PMI_526]|nr:hypothetical protein DL96DRAFT_1578121 [Flagelloscypha sp. PMI_526]